MDVGGHHWWFSERLRSPKTPDEPASTGRSRRSRTPRAAAPWTSCAWAPPRGRARGVSRLSAPAMSRHLRVLGTTGLVEEAHGAEARDARVRVYRLKPGPFDALRAWVDEVEGFWALELAAFKRARRARRPAKRRSGERGAPGRLGEGVGLRGRSSRRRLGRLHARDGSLVAAGPALPHRGRAPRRPRVRAGAGRTPLRDVGRAAGRAHAHDRARPAWEPPSLLELEWRGVNFKPRANPRA